MSVRHDVGAMLAADWSSIPALAKLNVVVTEKPLGDVRKPTALIRAKSISREPAAPNSHRRVGLLLTIIHPSVNPDTAVDALEEFTWALLDYIEKSPVVPEHEDPEFVAYGDRLIAVDTLFTVTAEKD